MFKQELRDRKKEAKAEVKVFSQGLKAERDKKLAPLQAELKTASESRKADLNKQIKTIKDEYVNATRVTRAEAKRRALKVMEEVGIPQPARRYKQYPFEFSGGMRQRIVIAIALTQDPDVLICDEPTTALDVTIQAQILELIQRLTVERDLTVMFITHDLGVVANMADRVAVMYAGKIVEIGTSHDIFYDPRHPYTWALLSSIPDVDSEERLEAIPGTPPNMIYPPKGDAFALRSKYAMAIDFKEEPPMFKVSDTHYAATWLLDERAPKAVMPKIVSQRINASLKKAGEQDA
ncbi:MAG: ABC transporter ATP-binding protein [Bacilli bacterium]